MANNQIDYSKEYFTIVALEDGLTVKLSQNASYYRIDSGNWISLPANTATPSINTGHKISFKITNPTISSSYGIGAFTVNKTFNVEGNIMSLLYGDSFEGQTDLSGKKYAFYHLLSNCTTLQNAENLILPATTLAENCYREMFRNCTNLISAPELPATILTEYCYNGMFRNCTNLISAPELPATTLAENCYREMFYGCSKLNYIKMLATNISAIGPIDLYNWNWVNGVASSGTFVKHPDMTKLFDGISGIPTGWTAVNTFNNVSPCIINQASESITFVYSDGLFTPNNEIIDLSQHFTKDELLSVQPECEITVTLLDKTDNVLASDYVWANDKTLSDVLNELGITEDVYNINVIITNVNAPEETGYYYYYMLDETEPFVKKDWMRIVSLEDYNTISLSKDIQYSVNGSDWIKLYAGNQITVNSDDIVYFKGTNTENHFTVNKAFNVEGNIMSLIYNDDFEGQTDLSEKNFAFRWLFEKCTTLQNAENLILPATTLGNRCYQYMFSGCTGLTSIPELPATTLADYCYYGMFYGTNALPDCSNIDFTSTEVVASGGLKGLFAGTKVTDADLEKILPKNNEGKYCLPVTTLANYCYSSMFSGCTGLTTAPELHATTLSEECYTNMFYNCSKLNKITMLATDISARKCLDNWVAGVADSGTFVKHPYMTSLPSGNDGIPTGWTVEDCAVDYSKEYFTIEALEDGLTVKLSYNGLEYRIDNGKWIYLLQDTATPSINSGQKISFKITSPLISSYYGIGTFTVNKTFNVTGNIMSLLYGDDFKGQNDLNGKNYAFYNLFHGCTKLQNAENLILPATTLANNCYQSMFWNCTRLISVPELPATTLANNCYGGMFLDCTSLASAPKLPATTLATYCYNSMFENCTGLTSAPELPATTLASYCYYGMFWGCKSLTTAPELPATTLAEKCYQYMFDSCTNLTEAHELPATTLVYACYNGMFWSCKSLTTAPQLPATTLASYCYDSMFYGCTSLTETPELPATILADGCYYQMFYGCSNLNKITMLATDISASVSRSISTSNCLSDWVKGVASNGTFVKNAAMTSLPSGDSGIPSGWTVKNYNENISNKKYLDKTGLTTLWEIITNKFATKAETITNVGIVDAANKATLQFTYADNTVDAPHTLDIVINPVNETNAGLMTPAMLAQLETAVDGTISNLKLNYNSTSKKLQLFDGAVTEGNVLTQIDATAFVEDGMLTSAELIVNPEGMADGTYLKLVWNTDAGTDYSEPIYINVTDLIDVYTAGPGIAIDNNKQISCTYTYTLPVTNDSTLGGIKTGYVDNAQNYAVKVDTNNNAYVAVPWVDTEYSATVQDSNLVQLGLSDTEFSIDESALTDRLSEIDATVKAKVESVDEAENEELISVDTDENKAVTIASTAKLSDAVEKAENSIQGVGVIEADKNIIGVEKDDDNNVTLSAGTDLKDAIQKANDAVKEINIGELEMKPVDGIASVAHDNLVGYFAITENDINNICY